MVKSIVEIDEETGNPVSFEFISTNLFGVEVINVTPHVITLEVGDECEQTRYQFPPSGAVARVGSKFVEDLPWGFYKDLPVGKTELGRVEMLVPGFGHIPFPKEENGVIWLASTMVAQASTRRDIVSPNTSSGVIRDSRGQVEAVTSFQRFV